jgi:hypothetical protein
MNKIIRYHPHHQARDIPYLSLGYSTLLRVDNGLLSMISSFLSFILVIRRRVGPQFFSVIIAAVGAPSEFKFVI